MVSLLFSVVCMADLFLAMLGIYTTVYTLILPLNAGRNKLFTLINTTRIMVSFTFKSSSLFAAC